jgi:hypothetical protein
MWAEGRILCAMDARDTPSERDLLERRDRPDPGFATPDLPPGRDNDSIEDQETILGTSGLSSDGWQVLVDYGKESPGLGSETEPPPYESDDAASDAGDEPQDSDADGEAIYDRAAAARHDGVLLTESIDELADDLHDLASRLSQPEPQETRTVQQIIDSVQLLKVIVRNLLSEGTGQRPDLAFTATTQVQLTSDEIKRARKRFGIGHVEQIWDSILAAVKRVSRWLWSVISHLVTVKEWTVTGQVGLGPIGLAQGSISVTFGP